MDYISTISARCRFAFALAAFGATLSGTAVADTLEVPDDFPTIARALATAENGDTIEVDEGVYYECNLLVDKEVTIEGGGPEETVIDAGMCMDESRRIFIVTSDATIEGFTLKKGYTHDVGGAVLVDGAQVEILECDFRDNTAESLPGTPLTGNGGAIAFRNGGGGVLEECGFYYNTAMQNEVDSDVIFDNTGLGGAILVGSGGSEVTVAGCDFDANQALSPGVGGNGIGGAILVGGPSPSQGIPASSLTLTDSSFTRNTAAISAGAVWVQGLDDGEDPTDPALSELGLSNAVVTGCYFGGNSSQTGGALFAFRFARMSVSDCIFENNFTFEENNFIFPGLQGGGAAIASACGLDEPDEVWPLDDEPFCKQTTVTDCLFLGNDARGLRGGAIYNSLASQMDILDCEFWGNRGAFGGGAITNEAGSALFGGAPAELDMVDCLVAGNEADEAPGGGVINIEGSTLSMKDSHFEGNTGIKGGAVANTSGSALTATDCSFDGNTAPSAEPSTGWGGAVFCAEEGSTMLVDDCSFTGNAAVTTDPDAIFDNTGLGGAMLVTRGSEVTVIGSSFDDNAAVSAGVGGNGIGGAIFLAGSSTAEERLPSTLTIEESSFTGNSAAVSGGAMWLQGVDGELFVGASSAEISGCMFQENSAEAGGAIFGFTLVDLEVTDSEFVSNFTVEGPFIIPGLQGGGGAIANAIFCNVQISGCTFLHNQGTYGRGGAVNNLFGTTTTIVNSEFRGNEAALGGGAVANEAALPIGGGPASMTLINCLLACNSSEMAGGGVGNFEGSDLTAINCTIADNTAPDGGGLASVGTFGDLASAASLGNSIVWGNTPNQIADLDGALMTMVDNSVVEGGWPGMGNLNADPLFVGFDDDDDEGDDDDEARGPLGKCLALDFRLSMASPAIDAGNNDLLPEDILFDLAGEPRYVDDPNTPDTGVGDPPVIDMGAYEYQYEGPAWSRWLGY